MNHEWCGPLDEDGNWCKEEYGCTLESTKPITRPKNEKRANRVFCVCAPRSDGKPREGRRMDPLHYKGKVVGKTAYGKALQSVIAAAWELGRDSRLKAQKDPKQRKSFWHDHAD